MSAKSANCSIATGGASRADRNQDVRLSIDPVVSTSTTRWRLQRAVHKAVAYRRAGDEGLAGAHSTQ
jgi:hypothetical protein